MIYKYILAIDPSGSYNEGKGTSGWCVLKAENNEIINYNAIAAIDYETMQDYWEAHEELLRFCKNKYPDLIVVIEDYLLYASKATQQINSRMETSQLLGILKYSLNNLKLPYVLQNASEVKNRWTDSILLWKGIINQEGKHYYSPYCRDVILNKHMRDAVRHAVHYNIFTNLKGSKINVK